MNTPAQAATALVRLRRQLRKAVIEFNMIEPGDRIMVALSGGKDSYTLLTLLDELRSRAPFAFELVPVHLDQGQPGYDGAPLRRWLEERGGEFHVLSEDTYSAVKEHVLPGKSYCSMCSRLRRGILYTTATRLGIRKIALGHHREDALETLLLNLFFTGQLKAMPPRLVTDDGQHEVLRPLLMCAEADIVEFAGQQAYPILPCNLCGSQAGLWREQVAELLVDLEKRIPNVRHSMLSALQHVRPSQLADRSLWTFGSPGTWGLADVDPVVEPAGEGAASTGEVGG